MYCVKFNIWQNILVKFMEDEIESKYLIKIKELEEENKKLQIEIAKNKTAELEREKYELNLQTIFDSTEIGFILIDNSLDIISTNSTANKWAELALKNKIHKGINFNSLLSNDKHSRIYEMIKEALHGNSNLHDENFQFPDGQDVWYRIRINPVYDEENVTGVCISVTDYTEKKIHELEKEKIASDLVQRNTDLEQFAYIVSHNLRAPIANILGISSILSSQDISAEDRKQFEHHMFTVVENLDEIVRDLNKILRVKREITEKKQKLLFSVLVEDIKSSIEELIRKENVSIITDFSVLDEYVTLKSYMHSIFFNLISNSIKFAHPDKAPVIEIKTEKNHNKFKLIFRDNGTGFDLEKKKEQVFKLYKRFHPDIEGKGMGLFMVKTQVEVLGGTITLNSKPNYGTEIFIEFHN